MPRPSTAHATLGNEFYDEVSAADFPQHILRFRNQQWAERIGLGTLSDQEWSDHFGRFTPLPGTFEKPLALRYHGHQFRTYNPELGDGRGFLFAQFHDLYDDRLLDLGTKGTGRTPWSRTADGRLTLKGGVREALASEMLEALGVTTSKTFSLVETGENLTRGDEPSPTRSCALVRLSHSHIRFGSFQRLAFLERRDLLAQLCDYVVANYMPDCADPDHSRTVINMLARVVANTARLGAQWTATGFVHGVLNTDNLTVTGESFDYGPWRFMPHYDPAYTAAYFDQTGLYAFGRQPEALAWNLTRLAECLVPLAPLEALEEALNGFWPLFQEHLGEMILHRLALQPASTSGQTASNDASVADLVKEIFPLLGQKTVGFEQFFFDWRGGATSEKRAMSGPAQTAYQGEDFAPLRKALNAFETVPDANLSHPYFARLHPRTMLIEEMEAIWTPIAETDDWGPFETAVTEIRQMRDAYKNAPEVLAGSNIEGQ